MFRTVSVKKLFILLLAAILALLLLFFVHGPFLDEGVEEAVAQALLDEAGVPEKGIIPAEGHKIFQAVSDGDVLQVWGIFCTGLYRHTENGPKAVSVPEAVSAKMIFSKQDGRWQLTDFQVPEDSGFFGKDMKELFPWHLRLFALMKGVFENGLTKQMEAYAA